jgi:hypothetical protein
MLGTFVKSIVRGAGAQVGRNLINNSTRSTKNHLNRITDPFDKALAFEIKGRSSTVMTNLLALHEQFCDKSSFYINDIPYTKSTQLGWFPYWENNFHSYREKIDECDRYFNLMGYDKEILVRFVNDYFNTRRDQDIARWYKRLTTCSKKDYKEYGLKYCDDIIGYAKATFPNDPDLDTKENIIKRFKKWF